MACYCCFEEIGWLKDGTVKGLYVRPGRDAFRGLPSKKSSHRHLRVLVG